MATRTWGHYSLIHASLEKIPITRQFQTQIGHASVRPGPASSRPISGVKVADMSLKVMHHIEYYHIRITFGAFLFLVQGTFLTF